MNKVQRPIKSFRLTDPPVTRIVWCEEPQQAARQPTRQPNSTVRQREYHGG